MWSLLSLFHGQKILINEQLSFDLHTECRAAAACTAAAAAGLSIFLGYYYASSRWTEMRLIGEKGCAKLLFFWSANKMRYYITNLFTRAFLTPSCHYISQHFRPLHEYFAILKCYKKEHKDSEAKQHHYTHSTISPIHV